MEEFFTPDEAAAWGGMLSLNSRITKQLEENLRRRSGLSHAEYEVLLRLFMEQDGKLRIQALAEQSVLSNSGTSRLIDRLESAGLVQRVSAEEDKRGAFAAITAEGREHFEQAAKHHTQLVRKIFLNHFSPEELRMIGSFWARLADLAE